MVFESLVADLLNRYLGEYVENLDKGQLKIGIWGGKTSKCSSHDFPQWKLLKIIDFSVSLWFTPLFMNHSRNFVIKNDYKTLHCEVDMSIKLVTRSRLIEQCRVTIKSNACTALEARNSCDSWYSSLLSCEWHHCSEFIFVRERILSLRPASSTLFTFVHEKEVKSEHFHVLAMAFRKVRSYVKSRNRIDMYAID